VVAESAARVLAIAPKDNVSAIVLCSFEVVWGQC
jgi:hypothetical protein